MGFDIIESRQPSFLLDGSVLITGAVPSVTGYEPGFPIQEARGCGHAGVVNISRYAIRLTGEPLYGLIGGFHLNVPLFEPLIPRARSRRPRSAEPAWLIPAHCTGWRAQHAMATRFGEAFVLNSVGTRLRF